MSRQIKKIDKKLNTRLKALIKTVEADINK